MALLGLGLVRKNVFIYHGFAYPEGPGTLLQPGQPIGESFQRAVAVNEAVQDLLHVAMDDRRVTLIRPEMSVNSWLWQDGVVSDDGVHLVPERIYPHVLEKMDDVLNPRQWEIPF